MTEDVNYEFLGSLISERLDMLDRWAELIHDARAGVISHKTYCRERDALLAGEQRVEEVA